MYAIIHAEIKNHDREIQRLLKRVRGAIGRDPGAWLDVACGAGQHLRALADAGVEHLAGVDNSPTQVHAARELLGGQVAVQLGDMRDFSIATPDGGFDVVSCLLSSIGHLHTDEDYVAALRRMAAHMHPRGALVLEPWIATEDFRPGRVDVDVAEADAAKVVRITKHSLGQDADLDFADLEFRFIVSRPGVPEAADWTTSLRLRLRTLEQQKALFAQVFGSVDFQSTGAGSRGVFLARRPL